MLPGWRSAPLLPVAVAATAGALLARWAPPLPLTAWAGAALLMGALWLGARRRGADRVAGAALLTTIALLAACALVVTRQPRADDLGHWATAERPLARVRCRLLAEPQVRFPDHPELRSMRGEPETILHCAALALDQGDAWQPVGGRLRVWVGGELHGYAVGSGLEILGRLGPPPEPSNPGEADHRQSWADRGIFAHLTAKSSAAVTPWAAGDAPVSLFGLLAAIRVGAREHLARHLRGPSRGLARAILLGDQTALDPSIYEAYQRTGVYHVLAISGQHLVILCLGLNVLLRLGRGSPRRRAVLLIAFIIFYALLTGARPPVVRATVLVVTFSLALLLGRRAQPLNSLALAWLLLFILQPSEPFQTGTQLSFVAVLGLMQLVGPLARPAAESDPLERLRRRQRPLWLTVGLACGWWLLGAYLATLLVWLLVAPLVAARFHLFTPVAVLIGPPLALLTAVTLMGGFLLLVVATLGGAGAAAPLGWLVGWALQSGSTIVGWAAELPGAWWYVVGPGPLALALFYTLTITGLATGWGLRYWRAFGLALGLWLAGTLGAAVLRPAEAQVTVLAVGHGNAAVVESPEGRVFLFDAGSLGGPEAATQVIAPFLWSRGHTRIDEVFLSHADLDHFNGLPALLERFQIGQVTMNPTFADKTIAGVRLVMDLLERRRTPLRVLQRGQVLQAGTLRLEVLHPPADGPPGPENARSLVLGITWDGLRLLLTGDLEPPGLGQVLAGPPWPADVLVAPHHGSPAANTPALADWVRARLVGISDNVPTRQRPEPYSALGAVVWPTFVDGAVILRPHSDGWSARSWRTGKVWP